MTNRLTEIKEKLNSGRPVRNIEVRWLVDKLEMAMQQEWLEAHDELRRMRAQVTHEGFDDLATMIAKYKTVMLAANETSIEQDEEIEKLKTDLRKLADCGNCKHEITEDSNCDKCKHTCACKHCLYGSNWEWRG